MADRSSCFPFPIRRRAHRHREAAGLRHLAFAVDDLDSCIEALTVAGVAVEDVRIDEFTGARFTFFKDPDGLPLELYEAVRSETGA